ncbi:hypothetical protein GCM10009801_29250 [Streptomyces albiaxialis]|uniref:Lipoprotein n=1 Tax=Streptomyces albiaxialis TaxID=329523 RepID=A0ABN2VW47_9ACTN
MGKQHRTALALAVCAATTAGGALQTQASAAPRTESDLDGLSGQEIARKAVKELNSASSLRLKMKARDLELDLTLDEKANCAGKITIPGKGSVKVIKRGGTVWMKPSAAFWRHEVGGEQGESAAERFKGRYIKGSSQDAMLGANGLATACDLDAFRASAGADTERGPGRWKRGGSTEVKGRDAVAVTRVRDEVKVRMLVADEGKPYPLKLEREAGPERDQIRLGRYDRPVPEKTPSKEKTIDVSELRDGLGERQGPSEEV